MLNVVIFLYSLYWTTLVKVSDRILLIYLIFAYYLIESIIILWYVAEEGKAETMNNFKPG